MDKFNEEELQKKLYNAGKKLEHLPQSERVLRSILEEIELCLYKVEQPPSKLVQLVMAPAVHSLIRPMLMRHHSKRVKLLVASCLSEITRIAARKDPYEDDTLREVLQLIVESFRGFLYDECPTLGRKVKMLEVMARARSCYFFIDLGCDELILQLFQNFIASICENQGQVIFSYMGTIMILIIDGYVTIPQSLISMLMTILRQEQDVFKSAYELVNKVIKQCEGKLKNPLRY
ncbi:hypothetical protein SUGI_0971990 [Cryptomeria japonica]|nr:hypothetical protein SUGI_0971990 [Cryptomeria japonica]